MYEILVQSLQTLSAVCDGAHDEDGMGFNGRDTVFGKSLAYQSTIRQLTEKQQLMAIKMLQTYRGQLARHGITLPTMLQYAGVTLTPAQTPSAPDSTAPMAKERSEPENGLVRHVKPGEQAYANKGDYVVEVPAKRVTQVTVSAHNGAFSIKFPYDPILVDRVKRLSRRSFNAELKLWIVPSDMEAEIKVALEGCEVEWDKHAQTLLNDINRIRNASSQSASDISIPNINGELRPFQKAGVAFIDAAGGRAIVGDDMGLGKTIQAIGYLALHPELRPAVIVVPASLKPNWRREIEKFLTINNITHVIKGTKPYDVPGAHIYIINYDILPKWVTWIEMLKPAVLICDEAHKIKEMTTGWTKAVHILAPKCDKVVLMTGTPIMNRPRELYSLLLATQPGKWLNFMSYARRYCNAHQKSMPVYNAKTKRKEKRMVWDFTGESNLRELHDKLSTVMIRRLKSEVMPELPAKTRVMVPMAINMKKYEKFMEDTLEELELAGNQAAQLGIIEKAKQYTVLEKMDDAFEWIDNFLESGEKIILFAIHKATVAAIMGRYQDKAVKITGDSSQKERDNAVQSFQNDPAIQLFVGNIQAAGVGLTLTAASNVAFVEFDWTPGSMAQAEDRAHRIGQQNAVTIWYLLAEGTVEEDIYKLLEKKRQTIEMVADGKVSSLGFTGGNIAGDLVSELLGNRKKKGKKK